MRVCKHEEHDFCVCVTGICVGSEAKVRDEDARS